MIEVWGHRGASAHRAENTIPAFRLAAEQGASGVELDVQLTADGEVVVIHDETLDRTTDGRGPVRDRTLAELRDLDAGGAPVPTLAEVLAAVPTLTVNVELKNSIEPYPGLEAAVIAAVAAAGAQGRVWYSSFNHDSMRRLKGLQPAARVGLLLAERIDDPVGYVRAAGADAIHPHHLGVTRDLVADAHAAALRVHVWTVDEPDVLRRMAAAGVDAVICNGPGEALAELAPAPWRSGGRRGARLGRVEEPMRDEPQEGDDTEPPDDPLELTDDPESDFAALADGGSPADPVSEARESWWERGGPPE